MKCLVSGATGFIGRRLCQQLRAAGHTVVALSRTGASQSDGAPTAAVDLVQTDPPAVLFEGVEVVFHLAGLAHQRAEPADYEALNHLATLRLARLCRTRGVRRFIFLSSVKAMGSAASPRVRAESDCAVPTHPYGLSKWRAEVALREEFAGTEMAVLIVRPALVYGKQVKGNLQRLARAVRLGLPRPPAVGERSMIAVDDLVDLLCHLIELPAGGVQTWIACGAQAYSTQAIYDLLRQARGSKPGVVWIPLWFWRIAARILDGFSGAAADPTYDKLFGTELYSNDALVQATGWRPRVALDQVIDSISEAELAML